MNKKPCIIWLGGWASHLECWKSFLTENEYQSYNYDFIFIDTHNLLQNSNILSHILQKPSIVEIRAWSMGSLFLHQWLNSNPPDNYRKIKIHSICPIFQFCDKEGKVGWKPSVIDLMIQSLSKNKNLVKKKFWGNMSQHTNVPSILKEQWTASNKQYSIDQLIQGLEYLKNTQLSIQDLAQWKHQIIFHIDPKDFVCKFNPKIWKTQSIKFHNNKHLPFLNPTFLNKNLN